MQRIKYYFVNSSSWFIIISEYYRVSHFLYFTAVFIYLLDCSIYYVLETLIDWRKCDS